MARTPNADIPQQEAGSLTTDDRDGPVGVTGLGQLVVANVVPGVQAVVDGVVPRHVFFDDVGLEVSENAPATTPESIANLDFASGLTGWVQYPPTSAESPSPTVSSGEVTFAPVSEYGTHKFLINAAAITTADALDKWIQFAGEGWCNDPTVTNGITRGGVSISFAIYDGATYNYTAWANSVERGDWTARQWWMRQVIDAPGVSLHVAILFKAGVGYQSKIRNLSVNVTDDPYAVPP